MSIWWDQTSIPLSPGECSSEGQPLTSLWCSPSPHPRRCQAQGGKSLGQVLTLASSSNERGAIKYDCSRGLCPLLWNSYMDIVSKGPEEPSVHTRPSAWPAGGAGLCPHQSPASCAWTSSWTSTAPFPRARRAALGEVSSAFWHSQEISGYHLHNKPKAVFTRLSNLTKIRRSSGQRWNGGYCSELSPFCSSRQTAWFSPSMGCHKQGAGHPPLRSPPGEEQNPSDSPQRWKTRVRQGEWRAYL